MTGFTRFSKFPIGPDKAFEYRRYDQFDRRHKRTLDKAMITFAHERQSARAGAANPFIIPEWRLHDIRRTGATNLQALGIPIEVTEAVLNHISGTRAGVAGIYNRYKYEPEKRAALEAWDQRLQDLVD